MREMVYSNKFLNPPEILDSGEYRGFKFYILNLGTHPCAYVDVSDTRLFGIDYDVINVDCHGGLTYGEDYLSGVSDKGWFIGWDYAHWPDFFGGRVYGEDFQKKWTTLEIREECFSVIKQIIKIISQLDV